MTVRELIEELQKFNQDALVVNYDHETGYYNSAPKPELRTNIAVETFVEDRKNGFTRVFENVDMAVVV